MDEIMGNPCHSTMFYICITVLDITMFQNNITMFQILNFKWCLNIPFLTTIYNFLIFHFFLFDHLYCFGSVYPMVWYQAIGWISLDIDHQSCCTINDHFLICVTTSTIITIYTHHLRFLRLCTIVFVVIRFIYNGANICTMCKSIIQKYHTISYNVIQFTISSPSLGHELLPSKVYIHRHDPSIQTSW